ncbi:MAG TPA: glycosyltransferase [Flavobacterium sp.]|nr:glycosyltransferase [Flavobacterium sp.]
MTSSSTNLDLEILISTMNRDSLDFLIPMFPFSHFSQYSILIINQTEKDRILVSDLPNVRVMNVFEKGLSGSRNTAIKNASKKIGLISDDDVVYLPGFDAAIVQAFETSENAIVTFNHRRMGLENPQNLSKNPYNHNSKTIWEVCSIEIAFRVNEIRKNNLLFNENFGLGAAFETAEELLFLRKALQLKLKTAFNPFVIEEHPLLTSGDRQGQDKLIFARAALSYKLRGALTYIWLPKFLLFLLQHNFIRRDEYVSKFKIGLSGIRKYKALERLQTEKY